MAQTLNKQPFLSLFREYVIVYMVYSGVSRAGVCLQNSELNNLLPFSPFYVYMYVCMYSMYTAV